MKRAAVSDLKARLAKYLRLVKGGEEVEIQERGISIAIIKGLQVHPEPLEITFPRKDSAALGRKKFTVHPKKTFDIVHILKEERRRK